MSARERVVAGVDGCRGGWLVVTARVSRPGRLRPIETAVLPHFEAVVAATRRCNAVAVDIPIGLSADGRRRADYEARRRIGPRRSSVFPPPPRSLLEATGYAAANAASKESWGRGLQRQTFNILPKIREADRCLTPALQDRVVESHPEVCFWALSGGRPLLNAKRTREGQAQRLSLLAGVYGRTVQKVSPPPGAARDDLYDSLALAWTAWRVASGSAVHLPNEPERDERGLRMEIVY